MHAILQILLRGLSSSLYHKESIFQINIYFVLVCLVHFIVKLIYVCGAHRTSIFLV